jgi:hypothetical protein
VVAHWSRHGCSLKQALQLIGLCLVAHCIRIGGSFGHAVVRADVVAHGAMMVANWNSRGSSLEQAW